MTDKRTLQGLPFEPERLTKQSRGRYRTEREIGAGGFGSVSEVFDRHLERRVALKKLRAPDGLDPDTLRRVKRGRELRFINEARITGKLEHPGIVPVYELGRGDDGEAYYVMRLVRGRTLQDELDGRVFGLRIKQLPRFVDVCHAVAYAHSVGVIHRDLKPENVMVGDYGETLVVDWGIAKMLSDDAAGADSEIAQPGPKVRTIAGSAVGTPGFMPPEQCLGELEVIDTRSDVYALGAVLYYILTGEPPHGGDTLEEVIESTVRGSVEPPSALEPECPHELEAIAMHALQVVPDERYPDAQALAVDVQAYLEGGLVGAHRYRLAARTKRWLQRQRWTLAAAFAVVVAAGASWAYNNKVAADELAAMLEKQQDDAQRQRKARRSELVGELDDILRDAEQSGTAPRWLDTNAFRIVNLAEPVAVDAVRAKLVAALEDRSHHVRRLVARALGGVGGDVVVKALIARLAAEAETDARVLIEIINALGVIGDSRAEEAVEHARRRHKQRGVLWEQTELAYRMIPVPADEPTDAEGWSTRGRALATKGKIDDAMAAFTRAIEANPKLGKAYNNRALLFKRLERFDDALRDYNKALEIAPDNPFALFNRAAIKRAVEDYDGALADYAQLVVKGWRLPAVHRSRYIAYLYMGHHELARGALDSALEVKHDDARTHHMLGDLLVEAGDFKAALAAYDRSLSIDPQRVVSLVQRAFVHRMRGDLVAAAADLDRAIEIDPGRDYARMNRAALRLHAAQPDDAHADLSHCIVNGCPGDRPALRHLNRAVVWHFDRGDHQRALADLETAFSVARTRSDQAHVAIAGTVVALRRGGGEDVKVWRARLSPRGDKRWHDRLLHVVNGSGDLAALDASTHVAAQRCQVAAGAGLGAELRGDRVRAQALYRRADDLERPGDVNCVLASLAARALDAE